MDNAQQHWKILRKLGPDLANKVRSFMVVGKDGDGVLVTTEDGQGFWFGTLDFESDERRTATEPTPLDVPDGLVSMAQGYGHLLLINKRGEIYSMGQNKHGQLGLGTEDEQIHFKPRLISVIPETKFTSVRCGGLHSLALTDDGKCWAWGDNSHGQLGVSDFTHSIQSPRQIPELEFPHQVVSVECGGWHSLALTNLGEVYAWGGNVLGQLGDGSEITTHIPTRILTPSPVRSMAAGYYHTLLLTTAGEVYACGLNDCCQLGLPDETESSPRLSKVAGLPFISQIATNISIGISIAMSTDDHHRCFVWGELRNQNSISTPLELPSFFSTVESPLSYYSFDCRISNSVTLPETLPSLSSRMSRMFDNPETSDVQFVVEQRTIHAHRIILSNSSDYFGRMFSETWLPPVDPEDPILKVTISDYSYRVFHTFLCLIYTDCLTKVHPALLPELFDLSTQYLVPDLQKLCLSRMRTTLSPTTSCLYYPLTHRYPLPELSTFQQDLVQFISTRTNEVYLTPAYHSMDAELCKQLTISIARLHPNH